MAGRPRKSVIKKEVKKYNCTCCDKEKKDTDYYLSESFLNKARGRLAICKDCIGDLYNSIFSITNSDKVTMFRVCRKLDIPFIHSLFDIAVKESNRAGNEIYRMYFQKMNSLGGANNYKGTFDDGEDLDQSGNREANNVEGIEEDLMSDFEITKDIILKWGTGLSVEDYWFLENKYDDYNTEYTLDTMTLRDYVRQACFTHLIISKKRSNGENVKTDLEVLDKLHASCNLKPNQETGMNSIEQATFGTLVKRWENEHPIPEPDPEWKDINKIKKYIKVWFTGHLSKMMGIESGVTNEYTEELDRYTVEDGESDAED